jgi:futalosine hydrolase
VIGLISSIPFESEILRASLYKPEKLTFGTWIAHMGYHNSLSVMILDSGIGKVNAASATTFLCEKFPLTIIINHGVCGAYPETGLSIGDICIAQKEVYGDEGVLEQDGWHGLERIGIPVLEKKDKKYFNEFDCHNNLSESACKNLKEAGMIFHYGVFVTVSTSSGLLKTGIERQHRFKGLCENMEGAAVAHIAALYGITFTEIRAVSNIVEDRDIKKWNLPLAARNCQKAVLEVLNSLDRKQLHG